MSCHHTLYGPRFPITEQVCKLLPICLHTCPISFTHSKILCLVNLKVFYLILICFKSACDVDLFMALSVYFVVIFNFSRQLDFKNVYLHENIILAQTTQMRAVMSWCEMKMYQLTLKI